MQFTWETFVVSSLGGVVAALLTQLITFLRDNDKIRRDRAYSALRVALVLERYASACHSHIMVVQGDFEKGKRDGNYIIPSIDAYPDGIDWRHIDIKISDDALSIPHKIENIRSKNYFESIYENNDYGSEVDSAFIGVDAYAIACRLREKYGLPKNENEQPHIVEMRKQNALILKRRQEFAMKKESKLARD